MEEKQTITDSPPSYDSIEATSGQAPYPPPAAGSPPQYPQPTAPAAPVHVQAHYHYPPQQPVFYVQSFVKHIVFACVVLWCCNLLFGFIAFILAS